MQTVARCRVRDLNATGILSKSWNGCVGETYLAWQIIVGNIDVLRRQIKVNDISFTSAAFANSSETLQG